MKQAMLRSGELAVVMLLAALAILLVGIETGQAKPLLADARTLAELSSESTTAAWTRTLEAVILTGDQFPEFISVTLDHLFAYSYVDSAWQQIPFQFDEVNASGEYATAEDGLLDSNDELAFMAKDIGREAPRCNWLADSDAQNYARYAIKVVNPLTPSETGWVYVYRSATLSPASGDYVTWDGATHRLTATTYIAGWDPSVHIAMDSLELSGTGVDVLDRQKVRLMVQCTVDGEPETFIITEENMKDQYEAPTIDGRVRVGGGSTESWSWYYASTWQLGSEVDYSALPSNLQCPDAQYLWTRQSTDWITPTVSGMSSMTYWDGNLPNGVVVDGNNDNVPQTPLNTWMQVSGARGSVVSVQSTSASTGTLTNYYYDDMVPNTNDTGDTASYGDAGFRLDGSPTMGVLTINMAGYVLGANQPKVGPTYSSYFTNPLSSAVTGQSPPLSGVDFNWSPTPVQKSVSTTFAGSAGCESGLYDFSWSFPDDGSTPTGNPVDHTFWKTGLFAVKLTVGNACGQSEVSKQVQVGCDLPAGTNFTWEPTSPEIEQTVTFSAQTTGGIPPITFAWDFGDGTTGSGANPTHAYSTAGSYTVKLTATNPCGEKVVTKTVSVTCREVTGLDMFWEPETPEMQQSVAFAATTTGGMTPITFTWDFGDGFTGSGANPSHSYSQAGSYTVKVTASNPCGDRMVTKTMDVVCLKITGLGMSWQPQTPEINRSVSFSAQTTGGTTPISFEWDFGDGSTGSGASPTHTYTVIGTYNVVLTATNACDSQVVTSKLTAVCNELTSVDFSWSPYPPQAGREATFSASSVGTGPITYDWQFADDGGTATGTVVTHTFASTGTHEVTLTARGACGAAQTQVHSVLVRDKSFIYLPLVAKAGDASRVPAMQASVRGTSRQRGKNPHR